MRPRFSLTQVAIDAGLVALAFSLSFELRFDGDVPGLYSDLFVQTTWFAGVGSVLVSALFGLYRHETRRVYVQIVEA